MNLLGRQVQYDLFTCQTHYIDLSARILGWIENNSNIFIQQSKTKLINPVDGILFLLVRFSFSIFYLPIASSVLFFISVRIHREQKTEDNFDFIFFVLNLAMEE